MPNNTSESKLQAYLQYGVFKWLQDLHLPVEFHHKLNYAFTHETIWNNQSSIQCLEEWFPAFLHCRFFQEIEHAYIQNLFKSWVQYETVKEFGLHMWNRVPVCTHSSSTYSFTCTLSCQPCVKDWFRKRFCKKCADSFYHQCRD